MNDPRTATDEQWRALLTAQIALHGRELFRAAFGVLKNEAVAEDVVQHALLKAWERRDGMRSAAAIRPWLLRTILNISLETIRRNATESNLFEVPGLAPDAVPDASAAAEQLEFRSKLLEALANLPERARSVVTLRVIEGLSGNEVKDQLGCSLAEVSRQLHLGLEILRKALKRSEFHGPMK